VFIEQRSCRMLKVNFEHTLMASCLVDEPIRCTCLAPLGIVIDRLRPSASAYRIIPCLKQSLYKNVDILIPYSMGLSQYLTTTLSSTRCPIQDSIVTTFTITDSLHLCYSEGIKTAPTTPATQTIKLELGKLQV